LGPHLRRQWCFLGGNRDHDIVAVAEDAFVDELTSQLKFRVVPMTHAWLSQRIGT